jgi:phage RecT family recombinase
MSKEIQKAFNNLKKKEVKDIVGLVHDVYKENGLHTELELQFIELKIDESPQLRRAAKANPKSLYNSILQAAQSGLSLNPQFQEGYFVPYSMKVDGKDVPTVTFSPMYRGKKKLLIVKGVVKNIVAHLVYEGECFDEDIVNGVHTISHKPNSFGRENHDKIVGGYAIITLNDGQLQYVVKGRDYFERCKQASMRKMGGKVSPAWREWFDQMCKKCLINAADSEIPKIGVNATDTKLLNDLNTNDVDYVDVTNEEKAPVPLKPTKKLSEKAFHELINKLYDYEVSLESAKEELSDYHFTEDQLKQIDDAGKITEKRLTEITQLIIDDKKSLNDFEFFLTDEEFETVKQAVIDNEMNKRMQ